MLIVGTAVNYAAKGGVANAALVPTDLDKGSVGIYGLQVGTYRDTLIVSGATAAGKTSSDDFKGKTVKVCEGLGGGKFKVSEFIDIKGLGEMWVSPYAAPVAWKAYIGYNGTSGGVIIDPLNAYGKNDVVFEIKERDSNLEKGPAMYASALIDATDTQQTILAKIKADLDAKYGELFTSVIANSGANYGLSITAKNVNRDYVISMAGKITQTPITVQGLDFGSGTYERLFRFEANSQAYRGDVPSLDYKRIPTSLVDGATYDTYILNAINSQVPGGYGGAGLAGNANVETSVQVQVVFASTGVNTAGGNQIEFETIMKDLTGQTFTSLAEAV